MAAILLLITIVIPVINSSNKITNFVCDQNNKLASFTCESYNEDENTEYNFNWLIVHDYGNIMAYDHANPDLLNTDFYDIEITRSGPKVKSKITIKVFNHETRGVYNCIEIKKPLIQGDL